MKKILLLLVFALGACAVGENDDQAARYFAQNPSAPRSARGGSNRLPQFLEQDFVAVQDAARITEVALFNAPTAKFGLSHEFSLGFLSTNGRRLDGISVAVGDWNHEFSSFKRDVQGRIFSGVNTISGDVVKSLDLVMGDSIRMPGLYDRLVHINFGYVRLGEEAADGARAKYLPYAFGYGCDQAVSVPGAVFRGRAIAGISSMNFDGTDARFMELIGTAHVEVNMFGATSVSINFPSYYNFHFENGELFMSRNANVGSVFALNDAYFTTHSIEYGFFGRTRAFAEEVGGVFSISQEWDRAIEINGAFGAKRDLLFRR
ncbi:MAG: hypothetical protein FWD15_01805 [Alphaproteobacteria bacterium]|nr:hypothetical protein [Alphaproteobacteria bacterium]